MISVQHCCEHTKRTIHRYATCARVCMYLGVFIRVEKKNDRKPLLNPVMVFIEKSRRSDGVRPRREWRAAVRPLNDTWKNISVVSTRLHVPTSVRLVSRIPRPCRCETWKSRTRVSAEPSRYR